MAERIRTTHVGSLPRPPDLIELLRSRHENAAINEKHFQAHCREAVTDCVAKQVECGIDYVSDGEMSKVSYAYYVQDRLIGMEAAKVAEASARTIMCSVWQTPCGPNTRPSSRQALSCRSIVPICP
ncbi:hypothetical protein PY365_13740 [Roseiarcaceae bacterium H3SJ34-1]|uniref:hypothetical protein n=1 Tax=Terripilifer ovatus TaxID=3032367 RepID=UPI003AB9395E|nr:hypothetical protein [Roseiarcaceae bacterium H3SJ34-1]